MQNNIKTAILYGGISEIATAAGVSITTASRVVNGRSRNKKVMKALAGYLNDLRVEKETIESSAAAINN